jgi:hypothetical protein
MALRHAGRGAARLLMLQAGRCGPILPEATPIGLHALSLHAAATQLPPLLPRRHAGAGAVPLPFFAPPPRAAALGGGAGALAPWSVALRALQVPSERKDDAATKALPDAQECDEAIEKYREVGLMWIIHIEK